MLCSVDIGRQDGSFSVGWECEAILHACPIQKSNVHGLPGGRVVLKLDRLVHVDDAAAVEAC